MTTNQASGALGGLVIVGNDGGTNVGASLARAARSAGLPTTLLDSGCAFRAPTLIARANWWLLGRRPTRLATFSRTVVEVCREQRPRWLLATGLAPIDRRSLDAINALGVQTINFLTDDPWNPAFRSRWFMASLEAYARVVSARRDNLGDLRGQARGEVDYLPFGFDPAIFFPASQPVEPDSPSSVMFAGGADPDRVPYMQALIEAGLPVRLYGDHWSRFSQTKAADRGYASPDVLRRAIWSAGVCLCLVRRANRDGHSMRSFEVPAAGGCMLVEDTAEHREIFGADDVAVRYFTTVADMVRVARELLAAPARRRELAARAQQLVWSERCTYDDRLKSLLRLSAAR